jgi:DsbC/DsbD-like thiol-disulfide interchange protein
VDRAARLLRRYTGEAFASPAEWRAWLTASRADLFFSDVGGYRFFSKAGPAAGHRRAVTAAAGDEPTDDHPVMLSAVVRPAAATGGDTVTVAVRMRIAPGWHTYAAAGKGGSAIATHIEETLPDGVKAAGAWQPPKALPQTDGAAHFTGDVVFLREFRLEANLSGAVELPLKVSFQVCDRERCLPPETVNLTARLEVRAKPGAVRGGR